MILSNKKTFFQSLFICLLTIIIISLFFYFGLFQNPSLRSSDIYYKEHKALDNIVIIAVDDASLQSIGRWPWNRNIYSKLLEKTESAKVVGFDISFFEKSENDNLFLDAIKKNNNVVLNAEYSSFDIKKDQVYGSQLLEPAFLYGDIGHINLIRDIDGTVRFMPLKILGEKSLKPFAQVIAEKYLEKDVNIEYGDLIDFAGKKNSFNVLSFKDVINGDYEKDFFNNKIVLVGVTAPDFHDFTATPFSYDDLTSGVEVHANIIESLIFDKHIKSQPIYSVFIFIILFALAPGILFFRFRVLYSLLILLVLTFLYFYSGFYFFNYELILNVFYPILSLLLSSFINLGFFYILEQKQKRGVLDIFEKYVSKEVMHDILKKAKNGLGLEGEKKVLSILFSDIRSFTTLSEKMPSHELVGFLNEYLTLMSKVIMENRGVVDKYIGDAIMAFWGAPVEDKQHSINACKAALGMKLALKSFKKEINIGIGINTGEVVVGNMGSLERMNYTVIGDVVNTASRLEGLTKVYSVQIIVGENTYNDCKDFFSFRELDLVKVKGKNKPIRIYELVGEKNEIVNGKFSIALELYRKKKFDEAIKYFKNVNDETSQMFIQRCLELKNKKLPKQWDGVFTMKSK